MPDRTLNGRRVLIVEDEYMLADDLRIELEDAGAMIVGPVATLEDAIALIESDDMIDGVILDVNLGGEMTFPVADLLLGRGVPFVFATGYDASMIPPRFADIIRCDKPINMRLVTQTLGHLIGR